jgi:hypothetical protein
VQQTQKKVVLCTVSRPQPLFLAVTEKKIGRNFSVSKLERFTFFAIFSVKE